MAAHFLVAFWEVRQARNGARLVKELAKAEGKDKASSRTEWCRTGICYRQILKWHRHWTASRTGLTRRWWKSKTLNVGLRDSEGLTVILLWTKGMTLIRQIWSYNEWTLDCEIPLLKVAMPTSPTLFLYSTLNLVISVLKMIWKDESYGMTIFWIEQIL